MIFIDIHVCMSSHVFIKHQTISTSGHQSLFNLESGVSLESRVHINTMGLRLPTTWFAPSCPSCQCQGNKFSGFDCMKMWPWMRDLPTSVWAGRGWAFDENGLRRLSSAGGSHAMQGVEVFESVGLAAEEVNPADEEAQEARVAVAATEHSLPHAAEQKPARFMRKNLVKQSGLQNVVWKNHLQAWEVDFYKVDSKGNKTRTGRKFLVKSFMGPNISEAQADIAALEAAKAFCAELVEKGLLREPKQRDPNFTSEVPGVKWEKDKQKWRVQIPAKKFGKRKNINGGLFTEKAAAEAKALLHREKEGLQCLAKPVATLASLPKFHPKVPYRGVKWDVGEQLWHARFHAKNQHFRVRPKDHSEAELERSFQVAVAWKKKQEKEKEKEEKAVKSKAKPGKKQRQ